MGGHESRGGQALGPLVEQGVAFRAVGVGRELTRAVADALAARPGQPVCVVPMSLGRDPRLVADTARALRWLAADTGAGGRLALTEPFGSVGHLIGWLRAAVGRAAVGRAAADSVPAAAATAVLLTAPAAGPFDDAELFRIARLVRQYGAHRWVEPAFDGGDPGLAEGVERCRLLGAARVLLVPAGFAPAAPSPVAGAQDGGPLLSPHAVGGILAARAAEALRRLRHGEDGIAAWLAADHGHGYAHAHAVTEQHSHGHPHSHPDPHSRAHPDPDPHVHPHHAERETPCQQADLSTSTETLRSRSTPAGPRHACG
ncbi:cobalamin biosynthesis protein CbiX [Streptacidiphilus sp. MAP12-33]|uniref:cobalamin biosynthesis protein CbiX n=1 Tax=Streptacidiphilus sp. MAP12-33 TaxID=3156266 RepID=UPI0035172AFB